MMETESERIVRETHERQELLSAAVVLFEGDEEAAKKWLKQPLSALSGKSPAEAPFKDVMDLIGRLEHGVFP
jgi:putative toxin-antitoxin system antitoxin component (TIGR02293 family)